jgi:predicted extracellular nuclease
LTGVIATTPVATISSKSGLLGFFVQERGGGEWSGILVVGKPPAFPIEVFPGEVFNIAGVYKEFKGETDTRSNSEIEVSQIVKTGTEEVPEPLLIADPGSIASAGALSENYQGVLVKVLNVTVLEAASAGNFGLWKVTGGLLVDKLFYQFEPPVGLVIWDLAGVLNTSYNEFKLAPRSAADIRYDAPDGGFPDTGGDTGVTDGGQDDAGVADGGGGPNCEGLTAHLVISQFASRGAASGNDDFVEIHNPARFAVDISGFKFQYKSSSGASWADRATVPAATSIAAGGYFLFANGDTAYTGPAADAKFSSGLADSASIRIVDAAGAELDRVGYGSGSSIDPEGTALAGFCSSACTKAFVRKAYADSDAASMEGADAAKGNAVDTNDNSADFVLVSQRAPRNGASASAFPDCEPPDAGVADGGCTPDCNGIACGADDGCGGQCVGTCPNAGEVCNPATFVCEGGDAGVPDAGADDAGVPDAGVEDAGVPDAGVADAGTTDGGIDCTGTVAHVVISQIATRGPGKAVPAAGSANDEFVELYNPGASDVDISGWKLKYSSSSNPGSFATTLFTVAASTVIKAKKYYLFAAGPDVYSGTAAGDAAKTGTTGIGIADTGNLKLEDAAGAKIDQVGFTTGGNEGAGPAPKPCTSNSATCWDKALVRKAYAISDAASMAGAHSANGNAYDTDDNAADLVVIDARSPRNSASPAAQNGCLALCVEAGDYEAAESRCDGKDNDCDGKADSIDTDLILADCEKQAGVCSGKKHLASQCKAAGWDVCSSAEYGADYQETEYKCDAKNNDCDADTDENCAIGFGNVQWAAKGVPAANPNGERQTITLGPGEATGEIYGQMYVAGFTDGAGDPATLAAYTKAQIGIGASDVADITAWVWTDAPFNVKVGNNYEYKTEVPQAAFYVGGKNDYRFAFRYSRDAGATWTYGAYNNHYSANPAQIDVANDAGIIAVVPCDPGNPTPCEKTQGVCAGKLHTAGQCTGGGWQACDATNYGADYEATESKCDGLDNDCDGIADSADPDLVIADCEKQSGVCSGAKHTAAQCLADGWQACGDVEYLGKSMDYETIESKCDGLDNDCDGNADAADADLVIANCEKQQGVCAGKAHAKAQCLAGGWQVCTAAEYGADYEDAESKCDAKDNDCNNTVDDNPVCNAGLWCRLQFPLTINGTAGSAGPTVYSRMFITGLTALNAANDPSPAVSGQVGYGATGSNPWEGGWTWIDAVPNAGWAGAEPTLDEYEALFALPLAATYDYAFRFSGDRKTTWTYCDKDMRGSGGADGSADGYQPANAGVMTTTADCTGIATHVVISQVQVAGAAASDEFVEIHNPTASDVDISGWELEYKSATGATWNNFANSTVPASTTLPARKFFLFTGDGYTGGVAGDRSYTNTMSGTAGHVRLLNGTGGVIDRVGYGATADSAEGGAPATVPPANQSVTRKSYASGVFAGKGNGYDTDNNANDFAAPAASAPRNSSSPIENSGCP